MIKTKRLNNEENSEFVAIKDGENKGVWLCVKLEKSVKKIYISTLIYIDKKIQASEIQYYLVKWDSGKEVKEKYISASNLLSDGFKDNDAFKYFIDNGLIISTKMKNTLIEYLKELAKIVPVEEGTKKLGWDIEENEFYGNGLTTNDDKKFIGSSGFKFSTKGNEDEYRNLVGQVFAENPLVFAICSYSASAFILPLLQNETNQALQLNGVSSKGKSGVINLALSMFTSPSNFYGFNNTKGSIFNILKSNNHHPICFDEVGESNMKLEEKINLLYALSNGIERGRLKKNDTLNEYETTAVNDGEDKLKYTVLIAGEKSFLDGVKREGTGIDARYIEILLPEGTPLWDSINTPEEAENLMIFLKRNYGFLSRHLIDDIKFNGDGIIKEYGIKLAQVREEFKEASPIVKRKIRVLAYSYVTSKILARYFYEEDDEQIISATDNAFESFKNAILYEIEDNDKDIYKEALSHIQDVLFKYLEDESLLESNQIQLTQKFGYFKIGNVFKEVSIISSKFTNVCQLLGLDERLFISYLKDKDLLVTEKTGNTKKIMKNGSRGHYYYIKVPHTFFADELPNEKMDEEDIKFLENSTWGK